MQDNEFKELERKEGTFFNVLNLEVETDNIATFLHSSLFKEILEKYSIDEKSITDMHFKKLDQKEKEILWISITYCKLKIHELCSMKKASSIRTVLNYMGYSNDDIKRIEYSTSRNAWVAKVYDADYDFDQDEVVLSAREYEESTQNMIEEVLGFRVILEFVV